MSIGSGLYTRVIDCLVSKHVDVIRWLGVFARDELPDVTCEIRLSLLILNTDPKNQPETHWLALYSPLSGGIEPFDLVEFSFSMYGLELLD